jgi:hypothetical protein
VVAALRLDDDPRTLRPNGAAGGCTSARHLRRPPARCGAIAAAVLGSGVTLPVVVIVAEVPGLVGPDRLEAASAHSGSPGHETSDRAPSELMQMSVAARGRTQPDLP